MKLKGNSHSSLRFLCFPFIVQISKVEGRSHLVFSCTSTESTSLLDAHRTQYYFARTQSKHTCPVTTHFMATPRYSLLFVQDRKWKMLPDPPPIFPLKTSRKIQQDACKKELEVLCQSVKRVYCPNLIQDKRVLGMGQKSRIQESLFNLGLYTSTPNLANYGRQL